MSRAERLRAHLTRLAADSGATAAERQLARERLRTMPAPVVRLGSVIAERDPFGRIRGKGGMVQNEHGDWTRA